MGSALDVLGESLETFFDEVPFKVNLYSFLQPLPLPKQNFLPLSHVTYPPGRTISKTPLL